MNITHIGQGKLNSYDSSLELKNVLVILEIKKNLISVGKLNNDNDCSILFTSNDFVVKSK